MIGSRSRWCIAALCVAPAGVVPAVTTGAQATSPPALSTTAQAAAAPKIAFASKRHGNWEIHVMDPDGGRETRLTNRREEDRFPLWSPDAAKIAFGSLRDDRWELWVMSADGSNPEIGRAHV